MLKSEVHARQNSLCKPWSLAILTALALQAGPLVPTEWQVQAHSIAVRYEAPQEAVPAPADAGASFQVQNELLGLSREHTCCSRPMLPTPSYHSQTEQAAMLMLDRPVRCCSIDLGGLLSLNICSQLTSACPHT